MSAVASPTNQADISQEILGTRSLALRQKTLLWIFCFAFTFDFKGPTGSTIFQYVFTVVALLTGCMLWFQDGRGKSPPLTRRMLGAVSAIFILGYGAIILNNYFEFSDIPIERSLRVMFPYAMLVVSVGVVSSFARQGIKLNALAPPILVSGLVSILWRQLYASAISGVDLNEQRYQALSPAIMFLVPFVLAHIAIRNKQSVLHWILLGLSLISIYLSVTRIYMFCFAVTSLGVGVALFLQGRLFQPHLVVKRAVVGAVGLVGLVGLIFIAAQIRPNILESWKTRLSLTSDVEDATKVKDVSAYLRIAAATGMINGVTKEPFTVIMGKGFGAGYMHDRTHEGIIRSQMPFPVYEVWAIVDVGFVYLFFAGGIVVGGLILGVFLATLYITARAMYLMKKLGVVQQPFAWAATSFLAMIWALALMPTSYVFQERMSAQIVGIAIGIGMVVADRTNAVIRRQRVTRIENIRAMNTPLVPAAS